MEPLSLPFTENLPGLELSYLVSIVGAIALSSIRIGSFFIASPLFGYKIIPVQVRIVVSFAASFLIFDKISIPDIESIAGFKLITILFVELLIGVSCGLILTILFASSSLAGEKIAASTGLSFAGLIDPESGAQTPVLSQILSLFMIVIFLTLNGHLLIISLLLESYKLFPIGLANINLNIIHLGIDAGGLMFKFAALIMLPIVLGITLLNVLIGVVTRSAPTLNLFSFGFPKSMLLTFTLLYLSAKVFANNFGIITEKSIDLIERLIGGLL